MIYKIIHYRVKNGKFYQPEDLRVIGKFKLKLYTSQGEHELIFSVDGFTRVLVNQMNKNKHRFDRTRADYTLDDVKPHFLKFIRHQKTDLQNPVVQAMSSTLMELVLSGDLLAPESEIEGSFADEKPEPEGIKKD